MLKAKSKIKLFTHTDLDGVGCDVLGRLAFENIDVSHVDYHNVDTEVEAFIQKHEYEEYDRVFITDISVNADVAHLIQTFMPEKTTLLDHHQTALHLNSYDWADVRTVGVLGKESGTNMFFEYLTMSGFFYRERIGDPIEAFVEKVRRYDTWEWRELYNDEEALKLNNLFWLLGKEKFVKEFIKKFNSNLFTFSEGNWNQMFDSSDEAVLEVDRNKAEAYFYKKSKQMVRTKLFGRSIGVVFAEQYISELGNHLSEKNKDLSYIAIIDMGQKKVSLRTVKDDINLGTEVASRFEGGGHAKASGFQFSEDIQKLSILSVFSTTGLVDKLSQIVYGNGVLGKVSKFIDKFKR
ncbi:DHH family phosphoesterase [Bacillus pumilus]|uniref:DHH family phosphoesterase n=1 Tax=Bacillus pumilus TaxID=1408 RepID=UPI00119CCFF3|nr:hypothetical protein [Bacillus pumilus]